jgi:hypothetical protein
MPGDLGPQPTLARRGVTNTGQDDFVLDKAFALIEGFWEVSQSSAEVLRATLGVAKNGSRDENRNRNPVER